MRSLVCAAVLLAAPGANAYSVLTHEAIIDSAWERDIRPLLLDRFPGSTPAELIEAHAYSYAGALIQDMGYYPFGSRVFSDLVHYVRSGDFVVNLIREAQDLNEYAFALGSLAHYAADNEGHRIAVNPAVAIEFPKLAARFGPIVTYADSPSAHLKVEFGFDVLQVARGHYAPEAYHDFIGFKVSKPVLERAFRDTYCLDLKDVFLSLDLALGTFRHTVSTVIPEMTKVAWNLKKDELTKAEPSLTRRRFVYNLSRASYEKEWDRQYQRPGFLARILSLCIRLLPKVGPLKAAAFQPPTPQTVMLFEASFNRTLDDYRLLLADVGRRRLTLPDRDFDTGAPTQPGEYKLADEAYANLAVKLAGKESGELDSKVVDNILVFYHDLGRPNAVKADAPKWKETAAALARLQSLVPVGLQPAASPK